MARTHLMGQVLSLLRTARGAAARGVPLDEYAEEQAERRRMGRRRFLQVSAGAAGAAALGACGDMPPITASGGVAVVGGGIAGLHCAYRLRQLGVAAAVYEAGKRLGGRMFTDRTTFPEGMHCELGGELIDTGHITMLDLATELGIELYDYRNDDLRVAKMVAHIGGRRLDEADILAGFAPIAAAIDKALATLDDPMEGVTYKNANGGAALDAMSIKAWLDRIGAAGPVRALLEVAYTAEYGVEVDEQSALNLFFLISTDTMTFEIFGESDERFHTKLGNDIFITRLGAALDAAQIHLEHRLVALRRAAGGGYVLTFDRGGSSIEVRAEHVVLSLPFTLLREVDLKVELPRPKRRAIDEIGYGTNSKLMCGFSGRPWRQQGSDGSVFSDLSFQTSWETSRLQPGASGIITNFTGGRVGLLRGEGTPERQMAAFLDDFDKVFPGAKAMSNGKVARMHWPAAPFAKGSYAAYLVGQYTAFAGSEIERFENLHFCGEHASLDAQGFMEGGALTGAMAAAEVAADLGARRSMALFSAPARRVLARAETARRHGSWLRAAARRRRAARRGSL